MAQSQRKLQHDEGMTLNQLEQKTCFKIAKILIKESLLKKPDAEDWIHYGERDLGPAMYEHLNEKFGTA